MLLVRLDTELQIYQVYRYPKGYLKLRFKKMDQNFIVGFSRYKLFHINYMITKIIFSEINH